MKKIRQMSVKEPHLKEAYKTSIEPVQTLSQNRFRRIKLKDKPIKTKDPITEDEIDLFKRNLREMFLEMDFEKLQKMYRQSQVVHQLETKALPGEAILLSNKEMCKCWLLYCSKHTKRENGMSTRPRFERRRRWAFLTVIPK